MEKRLPPWWTRQLILIIVIFCIGTAPFLIILNFTMITSPPTLNHQSYDFQANLTQSNPTASLDLQDCNIIGLFWLDDFFNQSVIIRILRENSTYLQLILDPTFESNHFETTVPPQFYRFEVERFQNDTQFRCGITTSFGHGTSPVTYYWILGPFLIFLGIPLTYHFYRRTKKEYNECD